jgi:hypothetical protein
MGAVLAPDAAKLLLPPCFARDKSFFAVVGCANLFFHADQATVIQITMSSEITFLEGELLS